MIDITHKYPTLRKAIAKATVRVGQTETIQAILEGTVPKGDVFAMSKAAGLFAVKKPLISFRIAIPCRLNIQDFILKPKD